jgi:hypothetical protein
MICGKCRVMSGVRCACKCRVVSGLKCACYLIFLVEAIQRPEIALCLSFYFLTPLLPTCLVALLLPSLLPRKSVVQ